MRRPGLLRAGLIGALIFGVREAQAQNSKRVVGCYIAKPALTYSATGGPERGDSAWAYVQLSANGMARRPLLRNDADGRSSWLIQGDTLIATFHDGLVGWRLRLVHAQRGWRGLATYMSDARVDGQAPYQHKITLTRRSCAAPG